MHSHVAVKFGASPNPITTMARFRQRMSPSTLAALTTVTIFAWQMLHSGLVYSYVLPVALGTPTPMAAVLSGSMEPQLQRGDLLLGTGPADLSPGDIVIFSVPGREVPIVHRIVDVSGRLLLPRWGLY